ncbi:hypothetical protein BT69DRAFT_1289838 [Atractiella rhizophila]|nr:hypothetical protein BT69DRAFT_1289838 [Atractiella rhizophila]
MAPSILLTGLHWTQPSLPGWGWSEERVRTGLAKCEEIMLDAGYDYEGFWFHPDDTFEQFKEKLITKVTEKHWDGIMIGWGVRGNIQITNWFEDMVNVAKDHSPKSRLMFNWSPESTLDMAQRSFPYKKS